MPQMAVAARRCGSHLGYVVLEPVRSENSGFQIDCSVGRVEEESICVPLVDGGCDVTIGPGDALDRGHGLGAEYALDLTLLAIVLRR